MIVLHEIAKNTSRPKANRTYVYNIVIVFITCMAEVAYSLYVYNLSSTFSINCGMGSFHFGLYQSIRSQARDSAKSNMLTKAAYLEVIGLVNMKITYHAKCRKTSRVNKTLLDHKILNILFPKLSLNYS